MTSRNMKKCLSPVIIKKMKIKTIMDIASHRMAISKEINDIALASTGKKRNIYTLLVEM